jgi:hypothetical protein
MSGDFQAGKGREFWGEIKKGNRELAFYPQIIEKCLDPYIITTPSTVLVAYKIAFAD